jgi:hypothetical protein
LVLKPTRVNICFSLCAEKMPNREGQVKAGHDIAARC